jgi:autotransporter-associated beta strand protein
MFGEGREAVKMKRYRIGRRQSAAAIIAAAGCVGFSSLAIASPPNSSYRLVFDDEFDGNTLDTSKWSAASPSWTMPNSDSTATASDVSVGNGYLTLTATRTGATTFDSGSISSYTKYNLTGGYVEARIQLPSTPGSWPAFWGLYTGWPPEADIMEYPLTTDGGTDGLEDNQYNTNYHYVNSSGADAAGAGVVTTGSDLAGQWETFGMQWITNTSVAFYLNGTEVNSYTGSSVSQMAYMYMIFDYAVGGWPGTPSTTQWPIGHTDEMNVDWVRVWQTNPNNDATSDWTVNGSSAFGTASNWTEGVPGYGNEMAYFGRVGTASTAAVSMGAWQLFGGITFDGATNGALTGTTAYTLGGSGEEIQLSTTSGSGVTLQATSLSSASQTINAGVDFLSDTSVNNNMTGGQLLSLNGPLSGAGNVTTGGVGTTVFAGTSSLTGNTSVAGGALVINGGVSDTGTISVGTVAGVNAVLRINGTVNANGNSGQFTSSLVAGTVGNASGDIQLGSGATLNTAEQLGLGNGLGAYAALTNNGANVTAGSFVVVGFAGDTAVWNQNSGSLNVTSNLITVGAGNGTNTSNGVFNLYGGTVNSTATTGSPYNTTGGIFVGEDGTGTLNVFGGAGTFSGRGMVLGANYSGANGTVNLLGGTITTNQVSTGLGASTFNFNGGVLKASASSTSFFATNNAYVYPGGATIDDGGNSITIAQPLLAPTGNGVTAAGLTVSGSGFIDTPVVQITGGGGTGATAVANVNSSGQLTGITITNPGIGYASSPTFSLLGGGGTGSVSGNAALVPNVSGALTKQGAGTVTLTGGNTYTGGTNVNGGALVVGVSGALPTGPVNINNGTLQLAASTGGVTLTGLSISGSGRFDVNNNHVLIDYGSGPDPIASIAALIATGYYYGSWSGPGGITSSAAAANYASYGLGYADSADPGNPANLPSGTIEIKYTLLGDANLDGVVNGIDFGILAANFNKGVTGWDEGDFNYDNIVNGIDFAHLAANFNEGAGGISLGAPALDDPAIVAFAEANGLMADVPEPAAFGVLAVSGLGAFRRRRGKGRR